MISSNCCSATAFSIAIIGLGSPTAPSAVAPISRRRLSSVSRLDLATAMPSSRISAAVGKHARVDGEGAAERAEVGDEMRGGRGRREDPELGGTARHPIADGVQQFLAAQRLIRHDEVSTHGCSSLVLERI